MGGRILSEHSHTFPEFESLYYDDLILDDSFVGSFQQKWLKKNKFKYTLEEYFAFMAKLKEKHAVKTGIEVCNFQDQTAVAKILGSCDFDYVIGSVHFIRGWAYDWSEIKAEWDRIALFDIYEWYTQEIEKLCASKLYDVLGHPFNIRLFRYFPDFDVTPFLERAVCAMEKAQMAVTNCLSSRPRMRTSPKMRARTMTRPSPTHGASATRRHCASRRGSARSCRSADCCSRSFHLLPDMRIFRTIERAGCSAARLLNERRAS